MWKKAFLSQNSEQDSLPACRPCWLEYEVEYEEHQEEAGKVAECQEDHVSLSHVSPSSLKFPIDGFFSENGKRLKGWWEKDDDWWGIFLYLAHVFQHRGISGLLNRKNILCWFFTINDQFKKCVLFTTTPSRFASVVYLNCSRMSVPWHSRVSL